MITVVSQEDKHILQYGSDSIFFEVEYRQRKRLEISVYPDGRVKVIVPEGRMLKEVYHRVEKRAHWIAKQRAYFETFRPLPKKRRFVSGETHLYLGKHYRLRIQKGEEESVKLIGGFLMLYTPDPGKVSRIEFLLEDWYKSHARKVFQARLDWCLANALSLNLDSVAFSLRKMPRRWGSCSKAGNILLNPDLVKTPRQCIEYVITHELCHLRVHSHNPAYYRLLSRCMPDWEKRKERLSSFVI